MKIELNKFYKTRSGLKARIYALDGYDGMFIHGAIRRELSTDWHIVAWNAIGHFYTDNAPHEYDIVAEWKEVPEMDWSALPKWANYIALIDHNTWWFFENAPSMYSDHGKCVYQGAAGLIPDKYAPKEYKGTWANSITAVPNR